MTAKVELSVSLVSIGHFELTTAFLSAELTPDPRLFECRLLPLAQSHLAPAAKVRNPPFVSLCFPKQWKIRGCSEGPESPALPPLVFLLGVDLVCNRRESRQ